MVYVTKADTLPGPQEGELPKRGNAEITTPSHDQGLEEAHGPPPISRVSDDLLREIFVRTLHPSKRNILAPTQPPMLLTHVCRWWRRIAIDHAALWKCVKASFESGAVRDDSAQLLQLLLELLSRSKAAPLNLELSVFPWLDMSLLSSKFLDGVLSPIANNLTELSLGTGVFVSQLRPLPTRAFPRLERLFLELDSASDTPGTPPRASNTPRQDSVVVFRDTPSLTQVRLNEACSQIVGESEWLEESGNRTAVLIDLPWAQLTHVTVMKRTLPFILRHLSLCTHLHHLNLKASPESDERAMLCLSPDLWGYFEPISLPSLSSLTVNFEGPMVCPYFIEKLDAPRLSFLELRGEEMNLTELRPRLREAFLSKLRSWEYLTQLSLRFWLGPDPDSLAWIFEATPFVTTLDIMLFACHDEFLEMLTSGWETDAGSKSTGPLLPRLRVLKLDLKEIEPFDYEDVTERILPDSFDAFLEARARCLDPDGRLRKLVVTAPYPGNLDCGDIEKYVKEGLFFESYIP